MSETSPHSKALPLTSESPVTYLPTNNDATGKGNIEHHESPEVAYAAGEDAKDAV